MERSGNRHAVIPVRTRSNVGINHRYSNMTVEVSAGIEIEKIVELKKAMAQLC